MALISYYKQEYKNNMVRYCWDYVTENRKFHASSLTLEDAADGLFQKIVEGLKHADSFDIETNFEAVQCWDYVKRPLSFGETNVFLALLETYVGLPQESFFENPLA